MRLRDKNQPTADHPEGGNINTIAISIGFLLILLIAVITVARPYFSKKTAVNTAPTTNEDSTSKTDPKQISSNDLLSKISIDKDLIIIDVRSNEAFKQEHIANSQNIALNTIETKISSLNKNKSYVIVDSGSLEGMTIALNLFPQNDIKNSFYLKGGFPDWKINNNPTVSAGNPTSFSDQAKVTYINSDALKTLMETNTNLFIIDLHNPDNYKKEHLKGAVNIPLDQLESRLSEVPLGKKIVFYDRDGLWAFQAAVRFFDLGFFNTLSLSDGLDGWKKKNYPLEK